MMTLPGLPLVVASLLLAVVVVACASGEPPPFRTVPGLETDAVLANVPCRRAVAHAGDDLPCDYLQPIAGGSGKSCLLFAALEHPSGFNSVVPESDHSLSGLARRA